MFKNGLDLGEREKQVACHVSALALAMTDEARREAEMLNLTIFIASVSGSESHTLFINCFFHLKRPPNFRITFDAAEKNGRFGRIQCQRSKESSSREKRKRRVLLCRRTARVEVKSKVIPTSFLKLEGRKVFVGAKDRRKRNG